MVETDKEIIWDVEQMPISMANLEYVMSKNLPVTMKNVAPDILRQMFVWIDSYYKIGGELKEIKDILKKMPILGGMGK